MLTRSGKSAHPVPASSWLHISSARSTLARRVVAPDLYILREDSLSRVSLMAQYRAAVWSAAAALSNLTPSYIEPCTSLSLFDTRAVSHFQQSLACNSTYSKRCDHRCDCSVHGTSGASWVSGNTSLRRFLCRNEGQYLRTL